MIFFGISLTTFSLKIRDGERSTIRHLKPGLRAHIVWPVIFLHSVLCSLFNDLSIVHQLFHFSCSDAMLPWSWLPMWEKRTFKNWFVQFFFEPWYANTYYSKLSAAGNDLVWWGEAAWHWLWVRRCHQVGIIFISWMSWEDFCLFGHWPIIY